MKIALVASSLALLLPAVGAFAPQQNTARPNYRVSPLSAVINVQENANRDIAAMEEWAVNTCGIQRANGFQLTTEDGQDWSVMTTEPLPVNTPVLVVPNNVILSSSRAKQELAETNIAEAVDQLTRLGAGAQVPLFYLVAKILLEYERGDQSPYYPWLNALPRLYFNAVSMTDFCYECLPPLVFSLARAERVKVDNFADALRQVNFLSDATKNNKDLIKWAYNVVTTRCWGPDEDKQIVPMADMFNHGTETEIAIGYDQDGNCNMYTTRDVQPGEPLRMSYGDPTNPSHFFATYGFLDETSPATFCKIMTFQSTEESRNLGHDFSRMLFFKDTGDISQEVWDVVLYNNLASNREAQQAFYQAHMNGDAETKSNIHRHYFYETSSALKEHVDTFLRQLDELSAKGVGKDLNEHPRLPLIMRHNDFVKNTFLTVKSRLDPMVEQAAGELVV